ncbi:MAG: restriction endonuclease subunit S [Aphanizomenon gracile PMC638.10]|nr:restriction endonuclease subunit S [Aphanizomenon gracile PMC638.10]
MNIYSLLENFTYIAYSQKGIQKLKELVLSLGVRGKLVSYSEKDTSVSQTLKSIKKSRIGSNHNLLVIEENEKPFSIPSHWEWIRFSEIAEFSVGRTPSRSEPKYWKEGKFPWVSIADMVDGGVINSTKENISQAAYQEVFNESVVPKGTILMSFKLSIGKVSILDINAFHNEAIISIYPYIDESKNYLFKCLNGFDILRESSRAIKGKTLNKKTIGNIVLAFPPIEEQKRIVTKLEELIAICDQLEVQQIKLEEIRQKTTTELLSRVIGALTNEVLVENWEILQTYFSDLFVSSNAISLLKQAIIQLGIEGKLETQVETDETAQDLLNKLELEYLEQLRIKNADKKMPIKPISDDEIRFSYPSHWEIVRLSQLVLSSESGWSPQCDEIPRNTDSEWGVLKVSAVSWDKFLPGENKVLPEDQKPKPSIEVKNDDFLISRANTVELIAKSVVVENTPPKLMMSDKIIRLNFSSLVDKKFYNLFNNSKIGRIYYKNYATGTSSSMRNVSRQILLNMPVPLPSLIEQKFIIQKIETLLALCDDLDQLLKQYNSIQEKLSIALIETIINDKSEIKITTLMKELNKETKKNITVFIKLISPMDKNTINAKLAKILKLNGGQMEAKELWKASELGIDEFYALLKQEIDDGFIQKPDIAELKLVEVDE